VSRVEVDLDVNVNVNVNATIDVDRPTRPLRTSDPTERLDPNHTNRRRRRSRWG
jgi:hypothetical protein